MTAYRSGLDSRHENSGFDRAMEKVSQLVTLLEHYTNTERPSSHFAISTFKLCRNNGILLDIAGAVYLTKTAISHDAFSHQSNQVFVLFIHYVS